MLSNIALVPTVYKMLSSSNNNYTILIIVTVTIINWGLATCQKIQNIISRCSHHSHSEHMCLPSWHPFSFLPSKREPQFRGGELKFPLQLPGLILKLLAKRSSILTKPMRKVECWVEKVPGMGTNAQKAEQTQWHWSNWIQPCLKKSWAFQFQEPTYFPLLKSIWVEFSYLKPKEYLRNKHVKVGGCMQHMKKNRKLLKLRWGEHLFNSMCHSLF